MSADEHKRTAARNIPVAGGTPTEPGWYAAVMHGTSGLLCVRVYKEPHSSFPSGMFVKYDLHEFNLDDFEWGQSIDVLQDIQAALVFVGLIGTVDGVRQLVELRRQAEVEVEQLQKECDVHEAFATLATTQRNHAWAESERQQTEIRRLTEELSRMHKSELQIRADDAESTKGPTT